VYRMAHAIGISSEFINETWLKKNKKKRLCIIMYLKIPMYYMLLCNAIYGIIYYHKRYSNNLTMTNVPNYRHRHRFNNILSRRKLQ